MSRRAVVAFLVLGLVASWFVLMGTTFRNIYVEPTDEAVAQAAAARPAGVPAPAIQVSFAAVVDWAARVRSLAVLGLPGLLAGGWLLLVPPSHGEAWSYALLSSVPALAVVVIAVARRRA